MSYKVPILTSNRLNIFKAISGGANTIARISRATGLSEITVRRAVEVMREQKMVETVRAKSLRIEVTSSGHAVALRNLLLADEGTTEAIKGARVLVLLSLFIAPKDLDRISMETGLKKASARVLIWKLKALGAVEERGGSMAISPTHSSLSRFLAAFSAGVNEMAMRRVAMDGVMVWNGGLELIFSTSDTIEGADLTGPSAMAKFGVDLITGRRYHHISYWNGDLGAEEIAVHNIMIDPRSARRIGHSMLLLRKAGYDKARLMHLAGYAGITELVSAVVDRLDGRPSSYPFLPGEDEMVELYHQYGVT